MFINFRTPGLLPTAGLPGKPTAGRIASPKLEAVEARQGMRAFRRALAELDELERLVKHLGPAETVTTGPPALSLDLSTGAQRSTLTSTGRVSQVTTLSDLAATTTSPVNDPPGPNELSPGLVLTLSGTYEGLEDATMVVQQSGGWTSVDGTQIDGNKKNRDYDLTIDGANAGSARFKTGDPDGSSASFGNGLEVTIALGQGYSSGLALGDVTWTFDVAAGTIDPDEALSSAEFFGGATISPGTFELNGVTIAVSEADSLEDVLERIGNSEAGVTATYDATTHQVVLQGAADGPTDIVFANDTTGLVDALRLDGADVTLGNEGDLDRRIRDVEGLSFLQNGSFEVGGVSVSVNVNQDTLRDVIDRINDAGGAMQATFEAQTNQITLTGSGSVADGTSNFASTVLATSTRERFSSRLLTKIEGSVNELAKQLAIVDELFGGDVVRALKSALGDRLGLDDDTSVRNHLGLRFDFDPDSRATLLGVRDGASGLRRALRGRTRDVRRFMLGRGADDRGFVDTLRQALLSSAKTMSTKHGVTGLSVYA